MPRYDQKDRRKTFHLTLRMTEPWEALFYQATRHSFGYSKVALVRAMQAFFPLDENHNTAKKMSDAIKNFALDYTPSTARPTPAVERGEDVPHPKPRQPVSLPERMWLKREARAAKQAEPVQPEPAPVAPPKAQPGIRGVRLGAMVQAARVQKSLSQRDLSSLCGLPQVHISRLERGLKLIDFEMVVKLAKALDLDADTLIHSGGEIVPAPAPSAEATQPNLAAAGTAVETVHAAAAATAPATSDWDTDI